MSSWIGQEQSMRHFLKDQEDRAWFSKKTIKRQLKFSWRDGLRIWIKIRTTNTRASCRLFSIRVKFNRVDGWIHWVQMEQLKTMKAMRTASWMQMYLCSSWQTKYRKWSRRTEPSININKWKMIWLSFRRVSNNITVRWLSFLEMKDKLNIKQSMSCTSNKHKLFATRSN